MPPDDPPEAPPLVPPVPAATPPVPVFVMPDMPESCPPGEFIFEPDPPELQATANNDESEIAKATRVIESPFDPEWRAVACPPVALQARSLPRANPTTIPATSRNRKSNAQKR